jgi:L-ascorbate metabolism protein UlaG (beta-lactamase superfamily)
MAAFFFSCLSARIGHAAPPESSVLDQIKAHHQGVAIWWMGNTGWLIKSNDLLFATDPDLETEEKIFPPPISAGQLAPEIDVVFVTHHHGDHFNGPTLKVLAQKPRCTFVLPRTCLAEAGKLGIAPDRIVAPSPGQPFDIKGIHVEPIHAIHGNQDFTVLTREKDFIDAIANNCGYVFTIQGKRVLQPGDSVLTEEHLNLKSIDVLFVSPTVHNMYVDRSMILINRLEPSYIFPQHFETYREEPENQFWTKGYPDELYLRLSRALQQRYHKLKQGQMFVIR